VSTINEELTYQNLDDLFANNQIMYKDFLKTCINSFQKTTIEIELAYKTNNDFQKISELRHAIMPTVELFGLKSVKILLNEIKPANTSIEVIIGKFKKEIEELNIALGEKILKI
jgi:hypothetical protein